MTQEAGDQSRGRSRRPARFIGSTAVAAIAMLVGAWVVVGPPQEIVALVVLCALGILSQALRESNVGQRVTLSFLSIIQIASIPLVGPVGAAAVGGLAQALDIQKSRPVARLFNLAMNTSLGVIGGAVYLRAGGEQDISVLDGPGALLLHVAGPLILADAVQMVVNAGLIAGIVHADRGTPLRVTFVGMIANSGIAYLGYGVIAFLFVLLWIPAGVGAFSAVLILAPLFVARWTFVQYGDEVRAHESALSALVTAVETKDPASSGHSERIALLVDWVIEPLALSSQQASALHFAAMLHDVGRVGLPARLVRRPGDITGADLVLVAEHPGLGTELLGGVTFLEDSLEGILHHHERWDGRGYPDGLAGEAIPLLSRVIAVADAFDSLTMPRPYRQALTAAGALAQITAGSGSQFDPRVVDALGRALDRHTWEPGAVGPQALAELDGYFDHDDPQSSDLYAHVVADRVDPVRGSQ